MAQGGPTIEDVAKAAGVSRAAVSKVLRNAYGVSREMDERVNRAIAELGYRPRVAARAMRGHSNTIGVALPSVGSAFFEDLLSGIEDELIDTPYRTIIAIADDESKESNAAVESLLDRQVDGLVVVSPLVAADWLQGVGERVPMVILGRHLEADVFDTVAGDDVLGARLATEHLIGLGHRRIAHVAHQERRRPGVPGTPHRLRREAFLTVMAEHGLADSAVVVEARYSDEAAYAAVSRALTDGLDSTAVFAGADDAALGVLRAARDFGRSFALVGYDDTNLASHPNIDLSSVDQEGRQMGHRAAALVLERIGGRSSSVSETITPRLLQRHSSIGAAELLDERGEG